MFWQPLIEEPEIAEVVSSLRAAWPGTGPKVSQFEGLVKEYKCVKHAIAVSSCTADLPGDEVIAPPWIFCATVNAIIHAGGPPVLADIDPETLNIKPEKIRRRISSRTKALLPVNFAGRPCEMPEIMALAQHHGLNVIEDCAPCN